jgi:signal transduction histidine kinase
VLGFLFLLATASILFANLLVAERRVAASSGTSRFLDATLEMRRYEKNFLLYQDPQDLDAAVEYAASGAAMLRGGAAGVAADRAPHPEWLREAGDVGREARRLGVDVEGTARLLDRYAALLREARDAEGYTPEPTVTAVRDLGRSITLVAERLSSLEGESVQDLLRSSRRLIVGLVAVFLLGSVLLARLVRTTALRPLKALERGMQRIAAGELALLPVDAAASDEIASMNAAFNRMIGEIFEHREEVMRSERLASLGTMLAGIAHELNNPLSNVSTSAELLAEQDGELDPEARRELIRQIVSETDRATEIIRTVLAYSREPRVERRPTNLLSTLLDSVLLVRGELPAHVSVDLDVAPDLEVLTSRTKLQQAFLNLLKNAIDAMRDAGREGPISVSARHAPGDARVELAFRDRGTGIPPHVIDRVFDPFFSTKEVGHGTGLGLYLVHRIVEQDGGTIHVESVWGEGTTVTLRLPCGAAAPEAAAGATEARAQGGPP